MDANPDKYPDETVLKRAIAKIEYYNKGYQSGDVGSLLQFIEAISSISFNHTNYYLDNSDRLLTKQQRVNIGSDFFGSQTSVLNQTRYDELAYTETAATETLVIEESNNISRLSKAAENVASPYYEALFNEYDSKQTKLDIRKSQLLDAYLLKPLSMNAQGVYQPLAGKFTMLGSVQYSTRNNHTSINQPIYVNFKTGNIYLWADNFALLTSELADNKLGAKWQNKCLRIAIDDGTLPKGFGRAVIKSHIKAQDSVYAKAAVTQFGFIAPSTLSTLSPKLPNQQLVPMLQSQQVISRV